MQRLPPSTHGLQKASSDASLQAARLRAAAAANRGVAHGGGAPSRQANGSLMASQQRPVSKGAPRVC